MGSGPSKLAGAAGLSPGPGMTRQQLLAKTQGSRDYINLLFNQMIAKLTPEDYLKLGNPTTCSKFIFMMAESLQKHFIALRIRPARAGDTGVLYFQQMSRLQEDRESRELCLVVAYFFIRLFQIFGALAITCLDDPGAGETLGVLRAPAVPVAPAVQQRFGFFGGPVKPKQQFGPGGTYIGGQEGGDITNTRYLDRTNESILKPLLGNPLISNDRIKITQFPFEDFTENIIWLETTFSGTTPKILFKYLIENRRINVYANLKTSLSQSTIQLSDYSARSNNISSKLINTLINPFLKQEKTKSLKFDLDGEYISSGSRGQLLDVLDTMYNSFNKIVTDALKSPEVLEQRIREKGLQAAPGYQGLGQRTDSFTAKPLYNEYLIQILKSIKTQKMPSFCVARALQLMDASSMYIQQTKDIKSIKSSVCFDGDKRVTPVPKVSLDGVPGLRVLDALYKTNPHIKVAKEGSEAMGFEVEVDSPEEYAKFLMDISKLFGTDQSTTKKELKEITAASVCDSVKKIIQINNPIAIQQIVQGVQQMFAMQYAHTQKVLNFFRTRLFLIKKIRNPVTGGTSDYIEIHPTILKGGIPELAKVSKEARDILVSYYTNCESKYKEVREKVMSAGTRI